MKGKRKIKVVLLRASWKGNIQLGFVNIPVKLYRATKSNKLYFRSLCPECETALKRGGYYCPNCEQGVKRSEKKKGYEVGKDEYVIVEDEELEALALERSKNIELKGFIPGDAIKTFPLAGRGYYIVPQEGGEKPYAIFAERIADRVALGKVVFRRKEHLIGITSYNGGLIGQLLRYADEIREQPELDLPEVSDEEREMAEQLISKYTFTPEWDEFEDTYRESVKELIRKRQEGEPVEIEKPTIEEEEEKSALEAMKATIESA